jgi:hypothetical protein
MTRVSETPEADLIKRIYTNPALLANTHKAADGSPNVMAYDIALHRMDTCLDRQRNLSNILTVSYRLGVPG